MTKAELKKFLQEKRIEFLFGLLSTAIGVLIALLVNSEVNKSNDRSAFETMLTAIEIEAIQNKVILLQSFRPNYKTGIVRRKFSISNCDTYLANSTFLNHVSKEQLQLLMQYSISLKRANNFKEADEIYKYEPEKYSKWSDGLTTAFEKVLDNCESLIDQASLVSQTE